MLRGTAQLISAAACVLAVACGGGTRPTAPSDTPGSSGAPTATVHFVYRAQTTPRPGLPADCVALVGHTHIHPSWRGFARIDMRALGSDQWEISFNDVPVGVRQSIRVSDGNACDQNPTGAATQNVFANGVLLRDVVPTPGSGTEPGLAFTVAADGRVTP